MSITPDKKYSDRKENSFKPSWSANSGFINDDHKAVFEKTKDIPGWQMDGDSYKLFEMAYFAGDIILEIGTFGGRSAVVELLGALSAGRKPQFFGIEIDISGIKRTHHSFQQFNLSEHALIYHGTLQKFMKHFSIQPTMCFVDGDHLYEGVKRDLDSLSELLLPGIPVLCHDYLNPENDTGEYGIRRAASEWEDDGFASFFGVFGCSALFVTSDKCCGMQGNMSMEEFTRHRRALLSECGLETGGQLKIGHIDKINPVQESQRRFLSIFRKMIGTKRQKPIKFKPTNKHSFSNDNENKPDWLRIFPTEEGFTLISQPSQYAHDESKYDEQYKSESPDVSVGVGLLNLLHEVNADFEGPALEIGCGTGVLSMGLVNSRKYPIFILTDPSTAFLEITRRKLEHFMGNTNMVTLAVLKAEEIDKLPLGEFSLIILRSVLHHILDVPKFISLAALSLREGGILTFQEPCMEGYVLMEAMAQFIPLVIEHSGIRLSSEQKNQIRRFIDTMHFYARRDIDKSSAEDKHLFRVDEIMNICLKAGLSVEFLPNTTYEQCADPSQNNRGRSSFYGFFHDYLKYCMSFDTALLELIHKYFRDYCNHIDELSSKRNGPYMHGIFVCRKI